MKDKNEEWLLKECEKEIQIEEGNVSFNVGFEAGKYAEREKIFNFKEFLDSNISGRMIVNPYWLEHLLNLFFQEYLGEVWEEVMDTKINHSSLIENWCYGIIGQEFSKKHLSCPDSKGVLKLEKQK